MFFTRNKKILLWKLYISLSVTSYGRVYRYINAIPNSRKTAIIRNGRRTAIRRKNNMADKEVSMMLAHEIWIRFS